MELTRDELLKGVPEEIIGNAWVLEAIRRLRAVDQGGAVAICKHDGSRCGVGGYCDDCDAGRGRVVAWMFTDEEGNDDFGNNESAMKDKHYRGGDVVPLYTRPIDSALAERLLKTSGDIESFDADAETLEDAVKIMREAAAALGGGK